MVFKVLVINENQYYGDHGSDITKYLGNNHLRVWYLLQESSGPLSKEHIETYLGMDQSAVLKAVSELEKVGVVEKKKVVFEDTVFTSRGKKGLPEVELYNMLPVNLGDVPEKLSPGIGELKSLGEAEIEDGVLVACGDGEQLREKKKRLEQKEVCEEFLNRKLLEVQEEEIVWVRLSWRGRLDYHIYCFEEGGRICQ